MDLTLYLTMTGISHVAVVVYFAWFKKKSNAK